MERLTRTSDFGEAAFTFDLYINCLPSEAKKILNLATKLKEYEDLEEQSRLIKLPCKVGDTVYYFEGGYYKNIKNWKIVPIKVTEFNIKVNRSGKLMPLAMIANGTRYPISSIGKTVFLTKSEAEAKLKELKGSQNGKV